MIYQSLKPHWYELCIVYIYLINFNKNMNKIQTWGELIVNANALLMHYFFQVIQGND